MKLKPLYEVKLIANGKQHFYQIGEDETFHPGSTTALGMINKPALIPWAVKACSDNIRQVLMDESEKMRKKESVAKIADFVAMFDASYINKICDEGKNIYKKKAQDAADIGTRVHQAIDCLIRGETPDITKDIEAGVQGFIRWRDSNDLEIIAGDTRLGSKIFGYGGSLDFIAVNKKGEFIIFDNKTTKARPNVGHGIYPEAAYQLASYANAFHETYGIEVKSVYGLWLNKEKPEFKPVKIANLAEAFQGFLAALKLYKLSKFEMFEI